MSVEFEPPRTNFSFPIIHYNEPLFSIAAQTHSESSLPYSAENRRPQERAKRSSPSSVLRRATVRCSFCPGAHFEKQRRLRNGRDLIPDNVRRGQLTWKRTSMLTTERYIIWALSSEDIQPYIPTGGNNVIIRGRPELTLF